MNLRTSEFNGTRLLSLALCGAVLSAIWVMTALDERLNMARTHAHFTEATQLVAQTIEMDAQPTLQFDADGVPSLNSVPNNTGAWISALHAVAAAEAPRGGPAFIVNGAGSATTGAIGVTATAYGQQVTIRRPAFGTLRPLAVEISANGAIAQTL